MVTHQKEKYSWEFVFLGANIDAFATASTYGIAADHAINYFSSPVGASNAFKSVSRGMTAARIVSANGGALESFFENEVNQNVILDDKLDTSDISATIDKYTVVKPTDTSTVK